MSQENRFDVDGFLVYLTEDDLDDISGRDDISATQVLSTECPVVAEGMWDSTGCWLFYKTYSENIEYDMDYKTLCDDVVTDRVDLV